MSAVQISQPADQPGIPPLGPEDIIPKSRNNDNSKELFDICRRIICNHNNNENFIIKEFRHEILNLEKIRPFNPLPYNGFKANGAHLYIKEYLNEIKLKPVPPKLRDDQLLLNKLRAEAQKSRIDLGPETDHGYYYRGLVREALTHASLPLGTRVYSDPNMEGVPHFIFTVQSDRKPHQSKHQFLCKIVPLNVITDEGIQERFTISFYGHPSFRDKTVSIHEDHSPVLLKRIDTSKSPRVSDEVRKFAGELAETICRTQIQNFQTRAHHNTSNLIH